MRILWHVNNDPRKKRPSAYGTQVPAEVNDYHGNPLREGAHVQGWYDGAPYTATVKEIRPPEPGSGYRRIVLARDCDQAEVQSFSDAVAVITATLREARTTETTQAGEQR